MGIRFLETYPTNVNGCCWPDCRRSPIMQSISSGAYVMRRQSPLAAIIFSMTFALSSSTRCA
jgi:hypothetical protein